MFDVDMPKFLLVAPILKGVVMAVVLGSVGVGFIQSLIVALASSMVTGVFLLISTSQTVKATEENRQRIETVGELVRVNDVDARVARVTEGPDELGPTIVQNDKDAREDRGEDA